MKINLEAVLKDENGKPLGSTKTYAVVNERREVIKENGQNLWVSWLDPLDALTVKKVLTTSLLAGEEKMTKEQKNDDYLLFLKLAQAKTADLDTKEIERLKTVCGVHQPTLIYGQISEILNKK